MAAALNKKAESIATCGGVAQLGEHLPCKQGVKSSNLSISSTAKKRDSTLKTEYRKINLKYLRTIIDGSR